MAMPAIVHADLHEREALRALLRCSVPEEWPPPLITVDFMQQLKAAVNRGPTDGWTMWYAIEHAKRTLVALAGFKEAPVNGMVELSYTLLPAYQRQGLATETVALLSHWAFSHGDVSCIVARTLPELTASRRVLLKNGFVLTRAEEEAGVLRFERRRLHKGLLRGEATSALRPGASLARITP